MRGPRRIACVALTVGILGIGGPAKAQIDSLPRLGDAAGATLSPAAERRIGQTIMRDLRRDGTALLDVELNQYLNEFARTLAVTPAAQGKALQFFLLRDQSLNAFALPGGFVGVHTGLIARAQTESELASVLAHEIGHVTQRHIARMLDRNRQSSLLSLASVVAAVVAASHGASQAAGGLVALGGSIQEQQMLSFSRDAEREADRVGLEILSQANYQTRDMIAFFARLQRATRIYETGAPAYLRTHPLTGERMADIQNRVLLSRYRQRVDAPEFFLVKARLNALKGDTTDELLTMRESFLAQLGDKTYRIEPAAWFGLAVVNNALSRPADALKALAKAREAFDRTSGTNRHPFFERLQVEIDRRSGHIERAAEHLTAVLAVFPKARALHHLQAKILIERGQFKAAVAYLADRLQIHRGDAELWRMRAMAHGGNDQPGLAHWSSAEQYSLLGAWQAALEQYRMAQSDSSLDFRRQSLIDVRIGQVKAEILRERRGE